MNAKVVDYASEQWLKTYSHTLALECKKIFLALDQLHWRIQNDNFRR